MYIGIAFIVLILSMFSPSALAHLTDEDDIVKVVITDTGFEPDFVSVHSGSMVVWINNGNKTHWPASDFHPTHSIYPGSDINKCERGENILDACKGLEKEESFSFIFDQTGTWGIHDHLNPGFLMKVKVEGKESLKASPTILSKI